MVSCKSIYSGSQIDVRCLGPAHPNMRVAVSSSEIVEGMLSPLRF